jgi:hypothetical protein
LRHGHYSQINDQALTALGEDPKVLASLIAGAHQQWRPSNPQQAWIAECMASMQWKIDRSDRMQENAMAQAIQQVEKRRAEKALNTRYCYADVHGPLMVISEATLGPDYYTPPGYFLNFARALKVNPGPRMDQMLRLLHRLRQPEGYQPFTGRLWAGACNHKSWKETRELIEDGTAIPHPEIPIAQGAEREDLRDELYALAAAELEEVKLLWEDKFLPEADAPLTPQDRDELAANTYRMTELIRRQEHSCFREFFRLGTLLIKLKGQESSEERATVAENQGEMAQPDSGGRAEAAGPDQGAGPNPSGEGASPNETGEDECPATENASPIAARKNAGASGDVDENTGGDEPQGADFRPYGPQNVVELPGERASARVEQASR